MKPDEHYEVFDEQAEVALKEIGVLLDAALPAGYVYTLIVASVGQGGNTFYLSNGDRPGMIATMQEVIRKFEAQPE